MRSSTARVGVREAITEAARLALLEHAAAD